MQPTPKARLLLAAVLFAFTPATGRAQEKDVALRDLLRDGLYAEEVSRDPEAAAKHYEEVISRYAAQRNFAAAAMFRLAEVRRKQERKEEAVKLYQDLIAGFPGAEAEVKLAQENLVAMGEELPAAGKTEGQIPSRETVELAQLRAKAESSPDLLLDSGTLSKAAAEGHLSMVKFLLSKGNKPFAGTALQNAAGNGNLEMVKLLLDGTGPVPTATANAAIQKAIESERHTVLEFLLRSGLKPGNGRDGMPMLGATLLDDKNPMGAAEILLKYGADINEMIHTPKQESIFRPDGTALALTIFRGKFDEARWLLKKGAKVDVPSSDRGLTALHMAVMSRGSGSVDMMRLLLDAGADPNLDPDKWVPATDGAAEGTPFEWALGMSGKSFEKVALLLERKVNPNRDGSQVGEILQKRMEQPENLADMPALVKLLGEAGFVMKDPVLLQSALKFHLYDVIRVLLQYGADPNAETEHGEPLLLFACGRGDAGFVEALLEAGANTDVKTINGLGVLSRAALASSGDGAACMRVLLDHGVQPEAGWPESLRGTISAKSLRFLTDRFLIPRLSEPGGIHLVMGQQNDLKILPLMNPAPAVEPPDLAAWLLANHSQLTFPKTNGRKADGEWRVWRKGEDGKLTAISFDPLAGRPLPVLKPGDVIEWEKTSTAPNETGWDTGLDAPTLAALRKQVRFPVTLEAAGKSREVIIRGDRLVHDPAKDEMPVASVQEVADYFLQSGIHVRGLFGVPSMLVVTRPGWPDLRFEYGSEAAWKAHLLPGDHLKAGISDDYLKGMEEYRKSNISIQGPAYPYRRDLLASDGGSSPFGIPTLVQALVETQFPPNFNRTGNRRDFVVTPENIFEAGGFSGFTSLPFPDLSSIRIRRLGSEGKEAVIEVNLRKAIDAITTATSPEDARKGDVTLQAGDVIEVSPMKDWRVHPWKGFSPQENLFFAKVIAGRVQLIDPNGSVTVKELDYRSPDFVETAAGWVPVPAEEGIHSAQSSFIMTFMSNGSLKRGNKKTTVVWGAFLRDGDVFRGQFVLKEPRPRSLPPSLPASK